jgi:histidine phosphotransferase ChpT
MEDLSFTSMVCSKILHDLAGPIGAVMNGTELLEEGTGVIDQAEIIQLLKDSTDQLNANLQVFRIAFGALSTGEDKVDIGAFREALDVYAKFRSFPVLWETSGRMADKNLVKIILNSAFILGDAARKKGQVRITIRGDSSDLSFSVAGLGEGVKIPPEIRNLLEGRESPPFTTANMSAYIARSLANTLKLKLSVKEAPTGVIIIGQ